MELYIEILANALSKKKMRVFFENLEVGSASGIVENTSYKCIKRIANVLKNDELDDFDCIERIVRLLEETGVDTGGRHDFA